MHAARVHAALHENDLAAFNRIAGKLLEAFPEEYAFLIDGSNA